MTPATLTSSEVTSLIRHAVARKGGPERFARSLDVTPAHVECLLSGCAPGPKVMRLVGVVRDEEGYRYAK